MKEKPDFTPDKNAKVKVKINQALKECKEAEKNYRGVIYAVKEAKADHVKAMGLVLDMYQKEEEERVQLIKNVLITMAGKEQELNAERGDKPDEYMEVVNKITKEAEVTKIISDIGPKDKNIEEITFKKVVSNSEAILLKFDAYYSKGGPMKPFDIEDARKSITKGVDDEVDEKSLEITNTLRKLLSHCWEAKGLSTPEKEKFKDIIKEKRSRKLFCECLNQYRKQGIFVMSQKAFSCVVELLCFYLSQAEIETDIDSALSVIIMSQTFYFEQKAIDGTVDRVYLQQAIARHKFLNNEDFWTKVLDFPLNKDDEPTELEPESEEERTFREMNEMYVKLGTYAHNMIQFSLDKKAVERIIFTYANSNGVPQQYINAIQVFLG